MDEPDEQVVNISAEYALGDVLDCIFQYLKIKDLSRASLVCQLWRSVALKELSKRGPERYLIPSIFNKEFEDPKFHVSNLLNAKPYVAILFVGPSTRERSVRNLETEILKAYKKQFPHYLLAVGVDESMMDGRVINSCPGLLGSSNGILGLFLPLYNDLNIKVTLRPVTDRARPNYDESDILPDNTTNLKPIFIIFSSPHSYNNIKQKNLDLIRKKFAQKSYTLWGGVFDDDLIAIVHKENSDLNQKLGMFSLCITGSSLDSWSTVIDCKLEKHEVDKKLLKFRESIKFKRVTLGFVCGPRYLEDFSRPTLNNNYKNSHELMHVIKNIFPNIPFSGIFNYGYHDHFGVDSTSEDNKQKLNYQMTVCLLILSYN